MSKIDTAFKAIVKLAVEGDPFNQAEAVVVDFRNECADPAYEGQWPEVREKLRAKVQDKAALYGKMALDAQAHHKPHAQHDRASAIFERVSDLLRS